MPIFRFRCEDCGEEFEDFRSIAEHEEQGSCLSCGSGKIHRVQVLVSDCGCGCGCDTEPVELISKIKKS